MQLDLKLPEEQKSKASARVSQAKAVKASKEFQPTWDQVWTTGYTKPTGTVQKGIFQMKLSEPDKKRLLEVKEAVASGELDSGVTDRKKFNKSHALRLYKGLVEQRKEAIIAEMIANIPSNYHSVQTAEMLDWLIELMRNTDINALDTETTGLHLEKDKVVGMSITVPNADQHFYIPFLHENSNVGEQLDKQYVMGRLQQELGDRTDLITVMFNAKFDLHQLVKEGLSFTGPVYDALVGMKLLNENEPSYQLKKLANKWGKYFGYTDNSLTFEELFSKDPRDFYVNADYRLCYYYACKDTHLTWLLWTFIREQLEKHEGLKHSFYDREVPCTKVFFQIEQNGLPIDIEYAEEYAETLRKDIAELDSKIIGFFGELNWDSPAQVKELLYGKMGLKSWNGKDSTDKQSLKMLSKDVPELKWVLERRQHVKLLTSFIEPIPQLAWSDGRIHGQFDANGAKTGRTASKHPNMQNLGKPAKKMFKAPEGYLLVDLDFKAIEPRVLAHMSGDPALQKPYLEHDDLYVISALKMYGERYNMVKENFLEADDTTWRERGLPLHPRQLFKRGLLSTMYNTSAHGLSTMLDLPVEDAQQFIDDFNASFPVASKYGKDCVEFVDKHGYCLTMGGRKRRFPNHVNTARVYHSLMAKAERIVGHKVTNIWHEKLPYALKQQLGPVARDYNAVVRQVVNARTQGSAAELMKDALVAMDSLFEQQGRFNQIVGTVHDSMVLLVRDDLTPDDFEVLRDTMTGVASLDIPVEVDIAVSLRYGNDVPLAEWLEKGYDCFDENGFAK